MNKSLPVVLAFLVLFPFTVQAQEWTEEQAALWEWEVACWESRDLATTMACFHDDFIGWGVDEAEPTSKEDRRPMFAENFEANEQVSVDLRPIAINIQGNTAVLIYEAETVMRNRETGEETHAVERWTDVAMRTNGMWAWIADHGTPIEEGEG